jgi:hypothetical protein
MEPPVKDAADEACNVCTGARRILEMAVALNCLEVDGETF